MICLLNLLMRVLPQKIRGWKARRRQARILRAHLNRQAVAGALFRALLESQTDSSPELAALLAKHQPSAPRGALRLMAPIARRMDRMGSTLFGPERWRRWQLLAGAHLFHAFLLAWLSALRKQEPRLRTNGDATGSKPRRWRLMFPKRWRRPSLIPRL